MIDTPEGIRMSDEKYSSASADDLVLKNNQDKTVTFSGRSERRKLSTDTKSIYFARGPMILNNVKNRTLRSLAKCYL